MLARLLSLVIAGALLPPVALAQPVPNDFATTETVARSITTYERFTIFDDVTVELTDGVITLRGKVTMPFKRDDIGRRVEAVAAGYTVSNQIEVLPVSIHDDALRQRVARSIYGNPAFWRQAAMVNPPIHIIVERGRVTLTGVVATNVDRALARSLASGLGELSLTSALKTDAEVRAESLASVRRAAVK